LTSVTSFVTSVTIVLSVLAPSVFGHIVQSLSSEYAVVLGGYGPGYTELNTVDVVRHNRVCQGVISNLPPALSRFLGDVSGLAEFVDGQIVFCRHAACWRLNITENAWSPAAYLQNERDQSCSVSLGKMMVVVGGQSNMGSGELVSNQVEIYNPVDNEWTARDDLKMEQGRYSFCAVPVNSSSLIVAGGWGAEGALDSVEMLNVETGVWTHLPPMPEPRYGHTCLVTEVYGRLGVMVAGGALSGRKVTFMDMETGEWSNLPDTTYSIDGHKMILVEGIPTIMSWGNIEQFDGTRWRLQDFRLKGSRSAFTTTSIPGHLLPLC